MSLSRLALWRNAVRDSSDLSRSAKSVAWCLSTYMSAAGQAWPSQDALAAGCAICVSTVAKVADELEAAGFLVIERSRGRTSHVYTATFQPRTQYDVGGSPNLVTEVPNLVTEVPNLLATTNESAESAESVAAAPPTTLAASTSPPLRIDLPPIVDDRDDDWMDPDWEPAS